MKNILAENLLRFGLKNADVAVVNKLQSLSEQSEQDPGYESAGMTVGNMQLASEEDPVPLVSAKGNPIVFQGDSKSKEDFNNKMAAESGDCVVYRYSADRYIAMGMIGTFDVESNTVTNPVFSGILFRAIPDDGTSRQVGAAIPIIITKKANLASIWIANVVKALRPGVVKSRLGGKYLKNDREGKALLSGMISMYKMLGKITDANSEAVITDVIKKVS